MPETKDRIKKLYEVLILTQKEQEKLLDKTVDWIKKEERQGNDVGINEISGYIDSEMPGLTRDESLALAQMAISRYRTMNNQKMKEKLRLLYENINEIEAEILDLLDRYKNLDKLEVVAEVSRDLTGRYTDKEITATLEQMIEDGKLEFDHQQNVIKSESFKEAKILVGSNTTLTSKTRDALMKAGIPAIIEDMAKGIIRINDSDKAKADPILKKLGFKSEACTRKRIEALYEQVKKDYKVFDISTDKGIKDADNYKFKLYDKHDKVQAKMVGINKVAVWGESLKDRINKLHESLKEAKALEAPALITKIKALLTKIGSTVDSKDYVIQQKGKDKIEIRTDGGMYDAIYSPSSSDYPSMFQKYQDQLRKLVSDSGWGFELYGQGIIDLYKESLKEEFSIKDLIASRGELEAIARGVAPEVYVHVFKTSNVPPKHRAEAKKLLKQRYGESFEENLNKGDTCPECKRGKLQDAGYGKGNLKCPICQQVYDDDGNPLWEQCKKEWGIDPKEKQDMIKYLVSKGMDINKLKRMSDDALSVAYDAAKRKFGEALKKLPGVKPTIGTAAGTAKYIGTEVKDKYGRWNDNYAVRDGFWVIHEGDKHHVYQVQSTKQRLENLQESFKEQMLQVRRVPYGKDNVPEKDREYGIGGHAPVGTIEEWKKFAKGKGIKQFEVIEKDGKKKVIKVESFREAKNADPYKEIDKMPISSEEKKLLKMLSFTYYQSQNQWSADRMGGLNAETFLSRHYDIAQSRAKKIIIELLDRLEKLTKESLKEKYRIQSLDNGKWIDSDYVFDTEQQAKDFLTKGAGSWQLPNVKKRIKKEARTTEWNVYLHGKKIDTVFYQPGIGADEVRRGLIDHDGYDPGITVKKGKTFGNSVSARLEKLQEAFREDLVSDIMKWEDGQMSPKEEVKFFSQIIKKKLYMQLQGMYGRRAKALIDAGYLDANGNIKKQP